MKPAGGSIAPALSGMCESGWPWVRLGPFMALVLAVRFGAYWLVDGGAPLRRFCQWDCNWYTRLAVGGYDTAPRLSLGGYGEANWAFFPVFPLLIHGLAHVLGVSAVVAALVIGNVAFAALLPLAVVYARRVLPGVNEGALVLFIAAFPYGIYDSLPYTEGVFGALMLACLVLLGAERMLAGAWVAAVMSATRVPGLVMAPLVAWRVLAPAWGLWRVGDRRGAMLLGGPGLLPIAVAPLGLFLFVAYLQAHMGDGLAFSHIQAGWGRETKFPLLVLLENLPAHDWGRFFGQARQSVAEAEYAALIGVALCVWLWRQKLYEPCWVLGASLTLALSAGLTSMPRYVFSNPVFIIFLFAWVWRFGGVRRGFWLVLLACAGVQLAFVHFWTLGYGFLV